MKKSKFFKKKGHRTLSSFFGKELLYDYASNSLDTERTEAIKSFLKDNPEAQKELKKIQAGLTYVEKLKSLDISKEHLAEIQKPSSYLQALLYKIHFDIWPQGVKMALETLIISIGVVSVALLIPWNKLTEFTFKNDKPIVLAEFNRDYQKRNQIEEQPKTQAEFQTESQRENQETFPDEDKSSAKLTITTTTLSAPPLTPTTVVVKNQGYLFRGTISITNVGANNSKIVEKVTTLGARKAGDVPIGWRRGTGSYFHFTIPEKKYQNVLDVFNEYGKLKISKEKHDRIMPEGIIRIIINVEEPLAADSKK